MLDAIKDELENDQEHVDNNCTVMNNVLTSLKHMSITEEYLNSNLI